MSTNAAKGAADASSQDQPPAPLIAPTGNANLDVMADVINDTAAPFQGLNSPDKSNLDKANAVIGGTLGAIQAPINMLNDGFALLTAPLAKLFPPLPAATLGVLHLGFPHAHDHPPSFIPPLPPIPLPSFGPVILAGCVSVLINGIPAVRAGDIGISILCGTFTPPFEVFTGSSKVFFGGARAARMLDITKHCQPGAAAEKAATVFEKVVEIGGKALGVAGIGAEVLNAADQASDGNTEAAVVAGVQAGLDAAALALSMIMGLDPGIPPCFGALLFGMPDVLVGGFPMPPWTEIARGLGKLGKGLKKKISKPKNKNNKCTRPGEPIDPVSGAAVDEHVDYMDRDPEGRRIPFVWGRSYDSGRADRDGPMGAGFRHTYERELAVDLDRVVYTDAEGIEIEFPALGPGLNESAREGYTLRLPKDAAPGVYVLERGGEPAMEFGPEGGSRPRLARLFTDKAEAKLVYDDRGLLAGIVEPVPTGAIETHIFYDGRGHVAEVRRGPHGQKTLPLVAAYGHDTRGCLVAFQDALGAKESYAYDDTRRLVKKTDKNGYSFRYTYDTDGRCVEESGDDGLWRVSMRYEPDRRRTIVTTGSGDAWVYGYDDDGTIVSIKDPCGGELRRILDDDGRVVREVSPGGQTLHLLYDRAGRHYAVLDDLGYVRPPLDQAPRPPDPLAPRVPQTPREQQWGDVLDGLAPELGAPERWLPAPSLLASLGGSPSPRAPERRLDALGRLVESVDAAGYHQTWKYDAAGNVVRHTDRDGKDRSRTITSWNLVSAETDPLGQRTYYDYTPHAQVARVLDPGGAESRYEYDAKDRLARVLRHGVVREEYVYDQGDRLIEKRDGAGEVILSRKIGPNGFPSERRLASGEVYRYGYDARGRVIRASPRKVDVRRAFDDLGSLVRDERDGRGVKHTFAGGELRETRYLDRYRVAYRQAPGGALLVKAPVGGVQRIRRGEHGSVLVALGNGTRTATSYDHDGRCLGRVVWRKRGGKTALWSRAYAYSAEGELRRVDDSARGVTAYAYDDAHRLIAEEGPGGARVPFVLDAAGNVLEKPGFGPARMLEGNRLDRASGERFRYDARNHLAEHEIADGAVTRYRYDSLDMLVEVSWSERDETWTAGYDGLRRRLYKALGKKRTEYYWDGDRLAAEIGPTGALRIYVYPGPGSLVPFMFVDYDRLGAPPRSGRAYYVFGDALGVPLHIEDQRGNVVWRAEHVEPYGAVTVAPGASVAYALRFPGHYLDEETGLHYNRHRYYSPRLGRYLQSDPLGQAGGVNVYAYPASPLCDVDVLGLTPACKSPKNPADPNGADGEQEPHPTPPHQDPDLAAIHDHMETVAGPWATQAKIAALMHGDIDDLAKMGDKLPEKLDPVEFPGKTGEDGEHPQIGMPGAKYEPPTRSPGKPDKDGNPTSYPIHRGVPEVEMHNGEPHVRMYSTVYNHAPPDPATGRPSYKDVHQDPTTGKITMHTGAPGGDGVFWTSGGQPLRQVKWADKYAAQAKGKGEVSNPVIRSFLVPQDKYNDVSKGAIIEGMAGDKGLKDHAFNVDVHYASDQFGLRGKSLKDINDNAVPHSLISYAHDESHIGGDVGGEYKPIQDLRDKLGIPTTDEPKGKEIFVTGKGEFAPSDKAAGKADDLASFYGYWTGNDAFLSDKFKSLPEKAQRAIFKKYLEDQGLTLPDTWRPVDESPPPAPPAPGGGHEGDDDEAFGNLFGDDGDDAHAGGEGGAHSGASGNQSDDEDFGFGIFDLDEGAVTSTKDAPEDITPSDARDPPLAQQIDGGGSNIVGQQDPKSPTTYTPQGP